VNTGNTPALRFPIARIANTVRSISYGWLDISPREVRYTVEQPAGKLADGFSAAAAEVRDPKINSHMDTLSFRAGDKKEEIFYVSQDNWGSIHSGRDFFARMADGYSGTQSILRTLLDFDAELALVKSATAPPPAIAAPIVTPPRAPEPAAPPPPSIVMVSPSGAAANQTLDVAESPLVIRGVAMDGTGIPVVSINGTPANMRPQNAQAAEFWSDPLPLEPGNNAVRITASNSAQAKSELTFTLHYAPKAAPANPKALDVADIIALLQGQVSPSRVAEIVKQRGIKFTPAADNLKILRAAGATDELIQAVEQAAPRP
jgi:hypothetical protein